MVEIGLRNDTFYKTEKEFNPDFHSTRMIVVRNRDRED